MDTLITGLAVIAVTALAFVLDHYAMRRHL